MYNQNEEKIQNPEIKSAVRQTRVNLETAIFHNRLVFLAVVILFIAYIIFDVLNDIKVDAALPDLAGSVLNDSSVVPAVAPEVFSEALENSDPNPGQISHDELLHLLVQEYENLSFDFNLVEEKDEKGYSSGRTTCGFPGQLYTYYHENAWKPGIERGVWIEVVGCGIKGREMEEEYGTFALIYMPYEAFERVQTFEDYMTAIQRYGVIYQIHQQVLAQLLEINLNSLPPNQDLPKHPYMDS